MNKKHILKFILALFNLKNEIKAIYLFFILRLDLNI